jgi:dihydroneopterin aldolase
MALNDKIIIRDLDVKMAIGVTPEEQAQPQRLLISVELERDLEPAGRTDSVGETTDYAAVVAMICELAGERPRYLVEAVAHELAERILGMRYARAVTVEVKKFSIPEAAYISILIRRQR